MHPVRQFRLYRKLISQLENEIEELHSENNYLQSQLYTWDVVRGIQGYYSALLTPEPKVFKTTSNKSRSSTFEIKIQDIICIISDGKYKDIYFRQKQKSVEGDLFESIKLSFNGTIEEFFSNYHPDGLLLCKVSRSAAINVLYYSIDGNNVKLNLKEYPEPDTGEKSIDEISIGKEYLGQLKSQLNAIEHILSFQKIDFRSLENFLGISSK